MIFAAGLCLGVAGQASPSAAQQDPEAGRSADLLRFSIDEAVSAANKRRWRATYDVELGVDSATVLVNIRLVRGAGVNASEVERRTGPWRSEIEATWSDRVSLSDDAGRSLPLRVRVSFNAGRPHHVVAVKRRAGRVDQLSWPLFPEPGMIAHEFGHMIGAFDEYPGGGVDPDAAVIDPDNVMGTGRKSVDPQPRHYRHVARAIRAHADRPEWRDIRLVPRVRESP